MNRNGNILTGTLTMKQAKSQHPTQQKQSTCHKITASNPTETIYMPYDTPMTEETRDELLKSCMELATAHTTIKNLSEVVVNFSHTGNVVTTHQEAVTPTPQPTLKQTTPPQDITPPTT